MNNTHAWLKAATIHHNNGELEKAEQLYLNVINANQCNRLQALRFLGHL